MGLYCRVIGLAAGLLISLLRKHPASPIPPEVIQALTDLGVLRSQIESFQTTQGRLESALTTTHGSLETGIVAAPAKMETAIGELTRKLEQTVVSSQSKLGTEIEALKNQAQARRDLENELRAATRNIETVLVGSGTRGSAGEYILSNSLKIFPAGLIPGVWVT